jgi:arylformamidase
MNKRVKFDFEIDFTNGGGIQGQDFRLDIEGDDISGQLPMSRTMMSPP